MKRALLATLLLLVPAVAKAQSPEVRPENRVAHYIRTHKELLAAGAIIVFARMADAASSVHCLHVSIGCTEQNPFLPKRPSNAQEYAYAGGVAAGQIALNYLLWHFAPEPSMRHAIWLPTAGTALGEYFVIKQNTDGAEFLQEFCPPTCPKAYVPRVALFHREAIR